MQKVEIYVLFCKSSIQNNLAYEINVSKTSIIKQHIFILKHNEYYEY